MKKSNELKVSYILENYPKICGCVGVKYLIKQLEKDELQSIENILKEYGKKVDLDVPRDVNGRIDFRGKWGVKVLDKSYKPTGQELAVMKWYEGFEDSRFLVDFIVKSRTRSRNKR